MACNPVDQSCPPGTSGPPSDDGPKESPPAAAESLSPPAEASAFVSEPRADESLAALSERTPRPSGSVATTRIFLESWPHPVAPGVRYPVLDQETAWKVYSEVTRLDGRKTTLSTTTNFGRYWTQLVAFQGWLERHHPTTPFRALVVGAGLAPTIESVRTADEGKFPPESIAVLEWASLLDQAGLDFRLDVVDPSGEIEAYFETLRREEEHTFVVHDYPSESLMNVPATFAPQVFGEYAQEIPLEDSFPPWADHAWRVTLPRRVLERIHFVRGNVWAPLPGTGYDLIDYHKVQMHLRQPFFVPTHVVNSRLPVDVANLLLNLKPKGWLMSDVALDQSLVFHDLLQADRRGNAYRIYGLRNPLPVMERQPDGSWKLVVPSNDTDSGPGGGREGVSYRRSGGTTTGRDEGSGLLGEAGLLEGGASAMGPKGTRYLLEGARENEVPRLPARPGLLL